MSGKITRQELHENVTNELDKVGDLTELTTTNKESIVDAVNEVNNKDTSVPDASITEKGIVQLNNTLTSSSVTEAATANTIKMTNDKIGNLPSLTTTNKANLVNAINEVNNKNVSVPDASLTQKGIVQLNNTLTSTSTTLAGTANSVKQAYDRGTTAINSVNSHANVSVASWGNNKPHGFSSEDTIGIGTSVSGINNKGNVLIGNNFSRENSDRNAVVIRSVGGLLSGSRAYSYVDLIASYIEFHAHGYDGNKGITEFTSGEVRIHDNLSVSGTKNFEIPYPHPNKKNTHVLRHGAVESPSAGENLYRFSIEANSENEIVEVELPDYFMYLNKNIDVWVNGDGHFAHAFGFIENDTLKIKCEKKGKYKILVIGTRNDENVQDWHIKGVEKEVGEDWYGNPIELKIDELITEYEFITEEVNI